MDPLTLRQVLLAMHLLGLVLQAGTTVTEFVAFRLFASLLKANGQASAGLLRLLSGLGIVLLAGGILLVVSGAGLMLLSEGVYWHQLWLQLKLGLILLLPLNGMLVGSPQLKRLRNSLATGGVELGLASRSAVSRLTLFHSVQTLVLVAIIILAVFKVN